jgi:hypothetical protein
MNFRASGQKLNELHPTLINEVISFGFTRSLAHENTSVIRSSQTDRTASGSSSGGLEVGDLGGVVRSWRLLCVVGPWRSFLYGVEMSSFLGCAIGHTTTYCQVRHHS